MQKTTNGTKAQQDELLKMIKTYNPRMTPEKLDALIAEQGYDVILSAVRGTVGKMLKAASKAASPTAGLFTGYKADADLSKKITAMIAALELPNVLVNAMSRKLSEQQTYDLLESALELAGKRIAFDVTVKARKSHRSPLDGLYRDKGN